MHVGEEIMISNNWKRSRALDVFLSEEESEILNVEIRRLKKCFFICKPLGGRPNRDMVHDMCESVLRI